MFIPIIVIFGGVWITVVAWRDLVLSWQSREWPFVIGCVTEKRILEGICTGITNTGTGAPITRRWKELELVYAYRVNDVDYSSTRFDFSGYGLRLNTHYYEDNEEVRVYYCPADPSIAVLQPGVRSNLLFGPMLVVTGLGCMAFFF